MNTPADPSGEDSADGPRRPAQPPGTPEAAPEGAGSDSASRDAATAPEPRRRRRRLIWILIAIVLALGAIGAVVHVKLRSARRQRVAAGKFRGWGVPPSVEYSFGGVIWLFCHEEVRDYQLAYLEELPELRQLAVRGKGITDAGLAHLRGLTKLEMLSLGAPGITGDGLKHLARMHRLRELELSGVPITDVAVEHLAPLPALEELTIDDPNITGARLERLANGGRGPRIHTPFGYRNGNWWRREGIQETSPASMACLEGQATLTHLIPWPIYVRGVRNDITDADLVYVRGLSNLEEISIGSEKVTDAGLLHLAGLTGLREINLSCEQVTDAGLAHLKGLVNLRQLQLTGTQVTRAGIEDLQKSLPACGVSLEPAADQEDGGKENE